MATRDELYAKFGITAEAAQLFETSLGTVFLAAKAHNLGWFEEQDPEASKRLLEKVENSTLGSILKKLRGQLSFRDDVTIYEQFERGLDARNQLTHGFFERHNVKIQSSSGRDEMIEELERLHEELFRCWRVAEGVGAALMPVGGASME
ncbi:hypothetical protein D1820_10330 [Phaeobacter sp. LSS9]|uniref:hypothetical protein n=1 Tax=unclassified Phaeobacter TaxID=2621772 RepID=UPI000E518A7E|nr:hypothetical protein [Phaeobacter sp. LSS9]AXT35343.1 hypothetical protein D1820_10330 [Phaeobacter sp. LSS9]